MRNTGRTTRLIDQAIQRLFSEGKVVFIDHYLGESHERPYDQATHNVKATKWAFDVLANRLCAEHGGHENFEFNKNKFEIKLSDLYVEKMRRFRESKQEKQE